MRAAALLDCLPRDPAFAWDWDGLRAIPEINALLEGMAGTPQEPEWHGEGDVLTHTRLVCEALSGLEGFRALEADARDALALAALLHDAGKLRCTRNEDGRLVSPRHGPVGAHMVRALLWRDLGLCGDPHSQRLREAACLLIRYHTRPLHMLEGENPAARAMKLASSGELAPAFTLNALCLLAEADVRGRISRDREALLDAVALARELAGEAGCLDGPRPFGSTHTARMLFKGTSVWPEQALFDDRWGEVVLLCGLPGTGKDTWTRANCPGMPVVSLDDCRRELGVKPTEDQGPVVRLARERVLALLRDRTPFVWNATSLTGLRSKWVELFERYGARVRIVFLETGWEENLRRNGSRAAFVPEDVIGGMLDRLEPPERWEAGRVEWLCT